MKRILKWAVSPIIYVLRQPRLAVEIGVMFLIALIWFAGPYFGLESVEGRAQAIIVVVLVRALVYVVEHLVAQRRAAMLEASLTQQGQRGRTDKHEDIEAVRLQFEKGIAALKDSKLAQGLSGKAALYALPWYMFIGPPASGKSTALRHSGLQFPSLSGAVQGLQGLGGTRNCDWWFTNSGVLLDTAGRYVTHEEDQEEWLAFLDMLKKARKDKPINGIIATISMADLAEGREEDIETHAKQMRARIDELITRLGVVFPVYVMVTKCDLVQGFVEFFDELNRTERERVWGCTYAKSAGANETTAGRFKREFDALLSVLHQRRLARLVTTRGTQKVSILGFPMQMASTRDRLARFVETLFQSNAYQESPLFRGFYFTSGTQEGTPIDRILGAVGRASGLSDVSVSASLPTESKSYFLKELFSDIIFPDRQLVAPSSAMYRQRGYVRVAALVVSVLFVALAVTGFGVSYLGNKRVLSETEEAAFFQAESSLDRDRLARSVELIGELGERFKDLLQYEREGVPFRLMGFYQGDKIREEVGEIYLRRFSKLFLSDTRRDIEAELDRFTVAGGAQSIQDYDLYYSLLKAYLMLGDPSHLKPAYINRWLNRHWAWKLKQIYGEQEVPSDVQRDVTDQIALYTQYLAGNNASRVALNVHLIRRVQEQLRQVPQVQRIYALSRREAEEMVKPWTIDLVLQGSQQGVLTSEYVIPGVYTLEGWKGPFQASVARILEQAGEEGWVIGEPEVERAQLDKDIKRLYFQDYVAHWRNFVRSLRVKETVTPANVEEVMGILALADSPLSRVMEAVDRNTVTEASVGSALQETAVGFLDKVKKTLGVDERDEGAAVSPRDTEELVRRLANPSDFSGAVSLRFKGFHNLIHADKEGKEDAPLIKYLTELRKVHQTVRPILRAESPVADMKTLAKAIVAGDPNDLLQAMKNTDQILQKLDPETHEVLAPVLTEPWLMSMRGILARVREEVSKRWAAEIYPACQRNVEGRYPFRQAGSDVPLADLAEVFHPDNGSFWKFYQAELKPFLVEGMDGWEVRTWANMGLSVSEEFLTSLGQARLLSESLFPKGSGDAGALFELYPYPPQGGVKHVTEILLEIGGQALRYRMEPQEWHEMKWPGPSPATGATLQVHVGGVWVSKEFKDWWGWLKMIQAGRQSAAAGNSQYRLQWELPVSDGQSVKIQYDLRSASQKNPFRPGLFEQYRCVEQL